MEDLAVKSEATLTYLSIMRLPGAHSMDPVLFQWPILPLLWAGVDNMETASLLQLHSWWTSLCGWGSPQGGHSTPWTQRTLPTTAPFAVMEAILDRLHAPLPSQLPGGSLMTSRTISASRDASKDLPGSSRLYHPSLSCHLSTFHSFLFIFLIFTVLVASLTSLLLQMLWRKASIFWSPAFPWEHTTATKHQ